MLADLERLIELQQVDLRLHEHTHQIELFPQRRTQAEQPLLQARERLSQGRARHTESLQERKKLELDVQQFEEKIRKYNDQLLQVKSNEAYRALQDEIALEEKNKAAAEDRELEAMIAAEEFEKEIQAAQSELARVEKEVAAALAALDQEQASRQEEAAALTARRDTLRNQVNPEMLTAYDGIARVHGGIALAEARDEVCQVCRIHIRPQTFAEVKRSDQIHYCESCHRILYYLPTPAPGVEQAVPARNGQAGS
ncbi:MAG: zinc ribbon domain-containing protein [Terriglobia bacterium]